MDTKHWEFVKGIAALTERELLVAKYIFDGYDNQRIAKACRITPDTARTHVYNVCRKFRVQGKTQLILAILRVTNHLRTKSASYQPVRLPYHSKKPKPSPRRKLARPRSPAKVSTCRRRGGLHKKSSRK